MMINVSTVIHSIHHMPFLVSPICLDLDSRSYLSLKVSVHIRYRRTSLKLFKIIVMLAYTRQTAKALLQPLCAVATRFYSQFSPKLPIGRNINEVSYAAQHTIASMCQPKMCDRPTAQECLDAFYKLDQIAHPRNPIPVVNVSVQATSNSFTNASVMNVSVQAVSNSVLAVSNSVQTSLKSRLDISRIRQPPERSHVHDVNFSTAIAGIGDFGIVSPHQRSLHCERTWMLFDAQVNDID